MIHYSTIVKMTWIVFGIFCQISNCQLIKFIKSSGWRSALTKLCQKLKNVNVTKIDNYIKFRFSLYLKKLFYGIDILYGHFKIL